MPPDASDYPQVRSVPRNRLFAVAWAVFFLILINGIIWVWFHGRPLGQRLPQHTSSGDVEQLLTAIRNDPRRKVVFIGGSILWGATTPDTRDTIPAAFASLLPKDVTVYNVGMIAARPLDEYLIAEQLQGHADLLILDYNYAFGFPIAPDRLLREPETYVRQSSLLQAHFHELLVAMPDISECFSRSGLSLPLSSSTIEQTLRSWYERNIPLFRYKDLLNSRLFGQHPTLLIQRTILALSSALTGRAPFPSVHSLLLPPEEAIDPRPWNVHKTKPDASLEGQIFDSSGFLPCLDRSFSSFVVAEHLPVVLYIPPNNPGLFPGLHHSEEHRNNIAILQSRFPGLASINMDDGTLSDVYFTGSTHLTPAGNRLFAERLFQALIPDLKRAGLLH